MKFSVGYQLREQDEESFLSIIESYKDHIAEVYFPWLDIPSGRGSLINSAGYICWEAQNILVNELKAIKSMGIKLDLLLNGNCYGSDSMSENLSNKILSVLEYLKSVGCEVDVVTTASPAIAHMVKKHFPHIEVRASVNMRIGTVKGMEYLADLFDSYHVMREYNPDLTHLHKLKNWADASGKKLVLLANSGCFIHCSGQSFHDNMVAHESEICEVANLKDFNPYVCWRALKNRENWHMLLENTWIRPEDIHHYEGLFDTVKLATRMHSHPGLVIHAYTKGDYYGNTLDLFEPGFGRALMPWIIDNKAFPEDWFEQTTGCNKDCHNCGYCKSVLDRVLLHTGG